MGAGLENPFVLWFVLTLALAGLAYAFVRKELRPRAVLYGAFLIACGVVAWPPLEREGQPGKVRLGLDLRGGNHLVLLVVTDAAHNPTVDDAVQMTREQLSGKGITFAKAERLDTRRFAVDGPGEHRSFVSAGPVHPRGLVSQEYGPRPDRLGHAHP